jgi:hypothetical protein
MMGPGSNLVESALRSIDDDYDESTSDEWGYIGCNSISVFNPYNNAICDNV